MLRANVNGLSIAYQRAGSGPALILLHGFLLDSRMWRPQIEALAEDFTVIAWDAPGAGQSDDPAETFGINDWADALARFLDTMSVERAHIVGLSWGGLVAQEFYRRHASRVLCLVLAGTYAGWRGSLPESLCQQRLQGCLQDSLRPAREVVEKYLPGMFSKTVTPAVREELAGIIAQFHPIGFPQMASTLAESDTRNVLPLIDVPTLLVWGDEDERAPLSIGQQMHQSIPGSRLAIIPGAGHVSNLEASQRFTQEVRDFCRSVPIARC
jgi:pimeloyl-ACP methyl ester carboxylesterase